MKKILQIILISQLFWISSCTTSEESKTEQAPIVNESFETFYAKFLSEDDFQIDRIVFPIKGRYMENEIAGIGSDTTDVVLWTKDNWRYIHKMNEDAMKDVKISKAISDTLVVIKIEGVSFNFLFEETYKIINGKWYLINLVDISM